MRDYQANKSNWRKVFGHIASKHRDQDKIDDSDYLRIRPPTAKEKDSQIKFDIFYGRTKWDSENEAWQCTKCQYRCEREKQRAMNCHIRTKHKEWRKKERIDCPYCPCNFKQLHNLSKHITNKTCPNLTKTEGDQIWIDIVAKNSE